MKNPKNLLLMLAFLIAPVAYGGVANKPVYPFRVTVKLEQYDLNSNNIVSRQTKGVLECKLLGPHGLDIAERRRDGLLESDTDLEVQCKPKGRTGPLVKLENVLRRGFGWVNTVSISRFLFFSKEYTIPHLNFFLRAQDFFALAATYPDLADLDLSKATLHAGWKSPGGLDEQTGFARVFVGTSGMDSKHYYESGSYVISERERTSQKWRVLDLDFEREVRFD